MSRRLVLEPDAEHDLDAIFDAIAADNPVALPNATSTL
jgi:plasmid stabilization system protein ParE